MLIKHAVYSNFKEYFKYVKFTDSLSPDSYSFHLDQIALTGAHV